MLEIALTELPHQLKALPPDIRQQRLTTLLFDSTLPPTATKNKEGDIEIQMYKNHLNIVKA